MDQAYVGQWALSFQSARVDGAQGQLHYPVMSQVLEQACDVADGNDEGTVMPVARDLAAAWGRCVHTTSKAVSLGLPSHNSQVSELGTWLDCTGGGDLRELGSMPDKAQRELSASVVSLAVHDFEERLDGATTPDASRRLVNWRSVCDRRAGRWVAAVPWDRHGHLNVNNTAYYVSFARRYRLERPRRLR